MSVKDVIKSSVYNSLGGGVQIYPLKAFYLRCLLPV